MSNDPRDERLVRPDMKLWSFTLVTKEHLADLERKLAEVREVIRPFAISGKRWIHAQHRDLEEIQIYFMVRDLRRAAQWYRDSEDKG